jgi:hypothetical protein
VTLATLTDRERASLLRDIAVALGLDPASIEPDRMIEVALEAREARDSARWRGIKLGPN